MDDHDEKPSREPDFLFYARGGWDHWKWVPLGVAPPPDGGRPEDEREGQR